MIIAQSRALTQIVNTTRVVRWNESLIPNRPEGLVPMQPDIVLLRFKVPSPAALEFNTGGEANFPGFGEDEKDKYDALMHGVL